MCNWIVDADQLEMEDFNNDIKILYKTDIVDSYINNDKKLGIEAPKGLGKTFLLKCKRIKSQRSGITCFPNNALCDILDKVTFNSSMSSYMENYANWVDLWKASVSISIHKALINEEEIRKVLNEEQDQLYWRIFENPYITTACQIMNVLLISDRADVYRLQTRIPVLITLNNSLHQPIHVFIDKTDQALRDNIHYIDGSSKMSRGPINRSFWAYSQIALAEASYQLFIQNSHIKVFFSIRSEALVGAEQYTDVFLQLRSYIVKLEYEYGQLKKMFDHYIELEADKWLVKPELRFANHEKAFIGLDSITHGYVKNAEGDYLTESLFQYLFRHTLKRPRDIMHICYRLCYSEIRDLGDDEDMIQKKIRHIINKESRLLLQSYLREMGPFVFDRDKDKWDAYWNNMDTNVFTYKYAKETCELINTSFPNSECTQDCKQCKNFKPFSALYNTGLLGIVQNNNVERDSKVMHFQPTGEAVILSDEELLPYSELYFLHPMVTNKAETSRIEQKCVFDLCKNIIVGDGYGLTDSAINEVITKEDMRLRRKHCKDNSIFLSSTCHDLEEYRQMLYRELARYDYNVVMSEKNDFGMPIDDVNSYDFCLDKVLECSQLIYIIGKRYGGEYRGTKYKYIADEIKKLNPKIEKPSISLMEFYLAKKSGLTTRVFTKKDIYNERSTYEKNKNSVSFIPAFVDSTNVFEIITLITRLETGNWFKSFRDLDDLLEIVKIEYGNKFDGKEKTYLQDL